MAVVGVFEPPMRPRGPKELQNNHLGYRYLLQELSFNTTAWHSLSSAENRLVAITF